jgi:RNA polymerase sigma-70 factor, ECF subfamily
MDDETKLFLEFASTRRQAALDEVLRSSLDRAYTHARRLLGNAADADDAVQEALLQLVRTAARFDGRIPFCAWLARLVSIRRDYSSDESLVEPLIRIMTTSADPLIRINTKAELTRLLERVPAPLHERITVALVAFDAQQQPVEYAQPATSNF